MTLEDQLVAARRELGMRKHAYPKWTREGKMDPQKAEHEIAAMQAICDTLQRLVDAEGQQPSLFGG